MSRTVLEHSRMTGNAVTGEIDKFDVKAVTIRSNNSDQFYMTYIEFIAPLFQLKSVTDQRVLSYLCIMMEYNTARVHLTTERRIELCSKVSIVPSMLSRSLTSLTTLGLISGQRGTYDINPFIFWKGSTDDRVKLLKTKGVELRIKFKIEEPEQFIMPISTNV